MELNYTILPQDFSAQEREAAAYTFLPLEKDIQKNLGEEFLAQNDFRIVVNKNSNSVPAIAFEFRTKIKTEKSVFSRDLPVVDKERQEKIRSRVKTAFDNFFFSLQKFPLKNVAFFFYDKKDEKFQRFIEKLEKSAGTPVESGGNDNLIKGKDLTTFVPVEPRYSFDKIYMSEAQRKEVTQTLNVLKNHDLIYKTWGFEEIDPAARTILNFYGPPGTGKTMTAHAIAHELGVKILELNYAEIESKYVGDAAKNMVNAFNTAKEQNALLFFDEADSFLSRRSTSGTSSSEQAMNSQRSQMLMLLENFKGIVIFCTNLIKNYDPAFESRILKSIQFQLPDVDARVAILKKNLPPRIPYKNGIPLTDEEFTKLSKIIDGFSGREIKNAVLKTCCSVAEKNVPEFEFVDFKLGFENAKKEFDEMKSARGGADKAKLEKSISENLKNGNYVEKSKDSVEKNAENPTNEGLVK